MLDVQYRMHPAISQFPSNNFYDKKLKDGVSPGDRPLPKGIYWPDARKPVVFYNVKVSYCNSSVADTAMSGLGAPPPH